MKEDKVYISGPVSGMPNENREAFAMIERFFTRRAIRCVNPVRLATLALPAGSSWVEYLKFDLYELIDCTAIVLLRGWWRSRGAILEAIVAWFLGYRFISIRVIEEELRIEAE